MIPEPPHPPEYSFFLIDRDRQEIVSAKRLAQILNEYERLQHENQRLKQINGCLRVKITNLTHRLSAVPVTRTIGLTR